MRKAHTVTQKSSDIENFKEVMISFVSKALSLTQADEQSLLENSKELPKQSALPTLIAHLTEKGVEVSLIEKLKGFSNSDAILANANQQILLKVKQ